MKLALCVLLLVALTHARVERVYPRKSLARGSSSAREISHQHEPRVEHEPQVETHDNHEPKVEHEPQVQAHDNHEPKEVLSHNGESKRKTEAYHPIGTSASRGHVRESQHQETSDHSHIKSELEKNGQHSRMDAIREALERDDKEHVRRTRSHHGYGNQYGHRHSSESSSSSCSSESHEHGSHGQGRYYQQGYSYQQGYNGYQQGYGGFKGYGR